MHFIDALTATQINVHPSIRFFWSIFFREEVFVGNALNLEACICLFDLLLKVKALEAFLSESAPLGQLLRTHIEVEDEVRLDQSTVRPKTPIET